MRMNGRRFPLRRRAGGRKRRARLGRNLQTGEPNRIPAQTVLGVCTAQTMKTFAHQSSATRSREAPRREVRLSLVVAECEA
jgi:hypothetical protein